MRRSCKNIFIYPDRVVLRGFAEYAEAYNVTPMTIELAAKPGETYTGSFEVTNSTGNSAEPVRVYMEDWDKKPDGDYVSMMAGSQERSCSSWLLLSPTQFDVPFHGTTDVNLRSRFRKTRPAHIGRT